MMSGTTDGGKKTADTIKERHGADFYKRIGSKGGKRSKGFSDPAAAGRAGGKKSKRGPSNGKKTSENSEAASAG